MRVHINNEDMKKMQALLDSDQTVTFREPQDNYIMCIGLDAITFTWDVALEKINTTSLSEYYLKKTEQDDETIHNKLRLLQESQEVETNIE